MELDLSLGDSSRSCVFMEKSHEASNQFGFGFNTTTLSIGQVTTKQSDQHQHEETTKEKHKHNSHLEDQEAANEYHISTSHKADNNTSLLQLDFLSHTPFVAPINALPLQSFPWNPPPFENAVGSCPRGLDMNMLPVAVAVAVEDEAEEVAGLSSSSPNSTTSSFQRGSSSRASDEDESGGSTRKKLRLSKEQSNFLEESFKEHNILNPKQKLGLAKQLHLRPRQVEVWFQNRRARTKLKQTEVDCEYLKKCCETLKEENRRLHKELQELRTLKTSNTFSMHLPATTLTMCPSCENVSTNSNSTTNNEPTTSKFQHGKPRF
ncbi:hypothetical protein TanjilG_03830 [Lupinus angustifolius]|uniref:Homeobox domain-containing protein n=1 Tax=Lupinus angustifolius TaxID=3871 RepID=A0A1J7HWQ9_LUPAN|nr:PREDICTED: homeobox-leucine zipper protein HOX11-like [Lupinus angustifolius]OIW06205.1 hypothetical protein TanjilG_03830 [Lupinus angustifolius]